MRRFLTVTWTLLGAVPACLVLSALTGYWTAGAVAAAGALCVLAIRNPRWRPKFGRGVDRHKNQFGRKIYFY